MSLVGQKIGPYEILEEIGRGGMGIVFKARHEKLGRMVALKMLAPHLAGSPKMRARFLREAKLQAGLSHPNVVNIFDYIEQGEDVFLVMEYVNGQTLEEMLLNKGRFSVAETLSMANAVLEALGFMHRKGLIHRDIKPSNIMVADTGLVKVTDFGIARLVEDEAPITKVGGRTGTLYYMAPETIKGEKLGPAADIYSLGVTLFQLLAGQVPFTGKTEYDIITAHLEKPPPNLQKFNPEVSPQLAQVVARALAKRPEERFSSTQEFLEAIRACQAGPSASPAPRPSSSKAPALPQLKRSYIWAGAAVLAIILLVLLGWLWYRHHQHKTKVIIPASVPQNKVLVGASGRGITTVGPTPPTPGGVTPPPSTGGVAPAAPPPPSSSHSPPMPAPPPRKKVASSKKSCLPKTKTKAKTKKKTAQPKEGSECSSGWSIRK